MLRLKINVNDGYLDLFDESDETFYITKQLYDLHSIENRQADYTRAIDVPRTPNNQTLLKLQSNERLGNESYICNVFIDDILQIPYGKLLIGSLSDDKIQLAILSGNFELFDSIPDSSIKTLNYAAYSFPWTFSDIAAIQTNTDGCTCTNTQYLDVESLDNGTGIIDDFVSRTDIKNYGFAFFYKTLIREIIEQSGYTVDASALANDDQYNNMFIHCPVMLPGSTEDVVISTVRTNTFYRYDASVLGGVPDRMSFVVDSDPGGHWNGTTNEWIVPSDGIWIIDFKFTISNDYGAEVGPAYVEILRNGDLIEQRQFFEVFEQAVHMTQTITLSAGDLIYIEVTANYRNSNRYDIVDISPGALFGLRENTPIPTFGLNVSDWIPDIKQKTALLDFLKLFNAVISSNPFTKVTKLIPLNDIINDTEVDFTQNFEATKDVINDISIRGFYRESIMKFDTDSDVQRTDGEHKVSFDNDKALPLSGTILSVGFSPSDDDGDRTNIGAASLSYNSVSGFNITAGTDLFSFNKDETFKSGDYIRYSAGAQRIDRIRFVTGKRSGQLYDSHTVSLTGVDVEIINIEVNEIAPRIGMLIGTVVVPQFTINGYSGANSVTQITVNRAYFNLEMNKIYTNYYKSLFDALQTPKVLKVWMNFSTIQFSQIDMTKPVKVDGLNGKFWINKIEQFKINSPCRLELIRLNRLI